MIPVDDALQQVRRKLLTLVMTYSHNLYYLFQAKELVIVNLASYERIGPLAYSLSQEEIAGTATEGNPAYGTLQQVIAHRALHREHILYLCNEIHGRHGVGQGADDAAATAVAALLQQCCVMQCQP